MPNLAPPPNKMAAKPVSLQDQLAYLLNDLDLSGPSRRYLSALASAGIGWPVMHELTANRVEAEYRKFLALKVAHGDTHGHVLAAPNAIHDFWALHVLDTRAYLTFTNRLGVHLHFDPDALEPLESSGLDDGLRAVGTMAPARRLLNAIDCYKIRFGVDPPVAIWGCGRDEWAVVYALNLAAHDHTVTSMVSGSRQDRFPTPVYIFVKMLDGHTEIFDVHLGMSVGSMKELILEREGIPVSDQRIIFGGKQLEDGRFLRDYRVKLECTLHLTLRLRGC